MLLVQVGRIACAWEIWRYKRRGHRERKESKTTPRFSVSVTRKQMCCHCPHWVCQWDGRQVGGTMGKAEDNSAWECQIWDAGVHSCRDVQRTLPILGLELEREARVRVGSEWDNSGKWDWKEWSENQTLGDACMWEGEKHGKEPAQKGQRWELSGECPFITYQYLHCCFSMQGTEASVQGIKEGALAVTVAGGRLGWALSGGYWVCSLRRSDWLSMHRI